MAGMNIISKLLPAWILMLIVSILFPLESLSATPCTTYEIPCVSTTWSATTAQHTTTTDVTRQSIAGNQALSGLSSLLLAPKMKTVLGNGADVAPFRGKPGYNVLDMDRTLPLDTRKAININWLDDAINRGDDLILKTDPIEWDSFMRRIGKESFYNEVELPHLMKRGVIDNVILDY